MGTRSLTFVYDHNEAILNLYRQFDGYPEGHGVELAEFLNGIEAVTNGIRMGETRRTANGMGCLAAQLVAHFKNSVGGFYIHSVQSKDCGQDYEYHVHEDKIVVKNYKGNELFNGSWNDFHNFCYQEA